VENPSNGIETSRNLPMTSTPDLRSKTSQTGGETARMEWERYSIPRCLAYEAADLSLLQVLAPANTEESLALEFRPEKGTLVAHLFSS